MLRSMNNLLERFHQSYFFYVLLSTKRFVSIAYYMPSVGCLLLVPIGMACKLWSQISPDVTAIKDTKVCFYAFGAGCLLLVGSYRLPG